MERLLVPTAAKSLNEVLQYVLMNDTIGDIHTLCGFGDQGRGYRSKEHTAGMNAFTMMLDIAFLIKWSCSGGLLYIVGDYSSYRMYLKL